MTAATDGRTILFVHPSDELYGSDRCLLELVRGLSQATGVVVALPRDVEYAGALSQELIAAGAEVRRLDFAVLRRRMLRPRNWPGLIWRLTVGSWRLARLARDCDAAIIHTNTLAAVSGPIAALLARRAHVWQVHEDISDEHVGVRLTYRLLALLPGRLVANSKATADALAGPVRPLRRKMIVVYPGLVDRRVGEPEVTSGVDRNVLRIAFVGRLAPRKGLAKLLEAVALLRSNGVELELSVFGTAPPGEAWRGQQYQQMVRQLGLDGVVRFEGFVEDVQRRLEAVDVLVVPSQRPEPFGLVVLEGMAAGCAVVVSRNGGGSDEILEHGVTGMYCGQSPSSIAAALGRLAGDPAYRERLGSTARTSASKSFGVERYREDMLMVYDDVT